MKTVFWEMCWDIVILHHWLTEGRNYQLVDFLLNSEMAVLGQVFKHFYRDSPAANGPFRWKTVGVTNEYAKENLRTAAEFRVVTPTQLHRWKQPQSGRETRYCKFNHGRDVRLNSRWRTISFFLTLGCPLSKHFSAASVHNQWNGHFQARSFSWIS